MAVLMRKHIRLGERTALGAKASLQFIEEVEVQIDLLVVRTIEWPHGAAGSSTGSLRVPCEKNRIGECVLAPTAGKFIGPKRLDAVDEANDAAVLAGVRVGPGLALRLQIVDSARVLRSGDLLPTIRSCRAGQIPAQQHEQDGEDQAQSSTPDSDGCPCSPAATPVLHLRRIQTGIPVE